MYNLHFPKLLVKCFNIYVVWTMLICYSPHKILNCMHMCVGRFVRRDSEKFENIVAQKRTWYFQPINNLWKNAPPHKPHTTTALLDYYYNKSAAYIRTINI